MIYTSGSTGTPKGVVVTHAGIAALAASHVEHLGVTAQSRILQFASLNFDASLWEIVMALTSGAALVLSPPESLSGAALRTVLAEAAHHTCDLTAGCAGNASVRRIAARVPDRRR